MLPRAPFMNLTEPTTPQETRSKRGRICQGTVLYKAILEIRGSC